LFFKFSEFSLCCRQCRAVIALSHIYATNYTTCI
jgi:hypothetical protein